MRRRHRETNSSDATSAKTAELRSREYRTADEIERPAESAKANRHGHRDATSILVAYRHGLPASQLTDLRWDQIECTSATLQVRRVKQGTPSTHPILGDEPRALRRLQRGQSPKSPFVFYVRARHRVHDGRFCSNC